MCHRCHCLVSKVGFAVFSSFFVSFVISLPSAVFFIFFIFLFFIFLFFIFLYICLHGFRLSFFFSFLDIIWTVGVNVLFGFVFYFRRCGYSFFDPLLSVVEPFFMIFRNLGFKQLEYC